MTDILLGEIVQSWEKFHILDFEAILRTRVISPGRIFPARIQDLTTLREEFREFKHYHSHTGIK